jgi:PAS domain S-box-containing protein
VVISFINITVIKKAEETLRKMTEELGERVKQRTDEVDEANQNLSHARDLFYALFHANPIPTSLTRLEDGLFMDVNDAYLEYYGLKYDHVIGRTSAELHLPYSPRVRSGLVARLEKEGMIRNLEMAIEHPSGETRNILAAVQRINLDGIDAMISTFSDITERVRSEQQVRDVASSLTASEQVERHRISRILHDDLQQNIFAVKMQLTFLSEALEKNDLTGLKLDLEQLDEWLAEAIATTRQLSVELSPPVLHGEGLTEAVIWLASQMKEQYSLDVSVHTNGVHAAFEDDIRVLVFQSIRELLFNVVKHSGTLKASLTFEQINDKAFITVSDGGLGFDSQTMIEASKAGHGLLRMRDRLMLLGCNLEVKSEPNRGTHITIEAPVKNVIN